MALSAFHSFGAKHNVCTCLHLHVTQQCRAQIAGVERRNFPSRPVNPHYVDVLLFLWLHKIIQLANQQKLVVECPGHVERREIQTRVFM